MAELVYSTRALTKLRGQVALPLYNRPVAQWTEHLPSKQRVEGSTPSRPVKEIQYAG
jgi:hypothetical protein